MATDPARLPPCERLSAPWPEPPRLEVTRRGRPTAGQRSRGRAVVLTVPGRLRAAWTPRDADQLEHQWTCRGGGIRRNGGQPIPGVRSCQGRPGRNVSSDVRSDDLLTRRARSQAPGVAILNDSRDRDRFALTPRDVRSRRAQRAGRGTGRRLGGAVHGSTHLFLRRVSCRAIQFLPVPPAVPLSPLPLDP
jgi:hypothetical protein